jgi:alkylation response protein AidB-like acyl-CoA dehydrogenase
LSERVRLGRRLGKFDIELWHSLLNERGWLAPNWPRQYGGCDWNAAQRHIYEEEACLAHAPRTLPFGLNMLAPVLMAFGSEL